MRRFVLPALVLLTAIRASAQISLPLKHLYLTSDYGNRIHPVTGNHNFHAGIDLRAHHDTVYAVIPGMIEKVGYDPFLGLFIKLSNGPFIITYGHLSDFLIFKGDSVISHTPLAISGATGRVTGEHLHFAVQLNGRYIDPLAFLSAALKNLNH